MKEKIIVITSDKDYWRISTSSGSVVFVSKESDQLRETLEAIRNVKLEA